MSLAGPMWGGVTASVGQYSVALFVDAYKKQPRLNIVAHGIPGSLLVNGFKSLHDHPYNKLGANVQCLFAPHVAQLLRRYARAHKFELRDFAPSASLRAILLCRTPVKASLLPNKCRIASRCRLRGIRARFMWSRILWFP